LSEVLAFLNQWGPWYLLGFGIVGIILQTLLYAPYMNLSNRILNSAAISSAMQKEEMPLGMRKMFDWAKRSIGAPYMRWLGIIQAVAMIVGGAAWLGYR
jgi:hypothetical protein